MRYYLRYAVAVNFRSFYLGTPRCSTGQGNGAQSGKHRRCYAPIGSQSKTAEGATSRHSSSSRPSALTGQINKAE